MNKKVKENKCLLNYKQNLNVNYSCEGESGFTPFCKKHLSEVFGVRLKLFSNILEDKILLKGPYLDTDYGRKHKQCDVLFFKRDILFKEIDFSIKKTNKLEKYSCNKTTLQYVENLKHDKKVDDSIYQYQMSILLNFLEKEYKPIDFVPNSIAKEANMKIIEFSNYIKDKLWYNELIENTHFTGISGFKMESLTPIELSLVFHMSCYSESQVCVPEINPYSSYFTVSYDPKVGFYVGESKTINNEPFILYFQQNLTRILEKERTKSKTIQKSFVLLKKKKPTRFIDLYFNDIKENSPFCSTKY